MFSKSEISKERKRQGDSLRQEPDPLSVFSPPSIYGLPDLFFGYASVPAKFSDSDIVMFFLTERFADLLQKGLGGTLATTCEVFNVFGEDDDALRYVGLERHNYNASIEQQVVNLQTSCRV